MTTPVRLTSPSAANPPPPCTYPTPKPRPSSRQGVPSGYTHRAADHPRGVDQTRGVEQTTSPRTDTPHPTRDTTGDSQTPPPRSGRGSSRQAWLDHARRIGANVTSDALRDEIIETVDHHNRQANGAQSTTGDG